MACNLLCCICHDHVLHPEWVYSDECNLVADVHHVTLLPHSCCCLCLTAVVPELYAKYAPLGKVGVNTLPSLGNFLHALNKTRADVPTLNFYNQLAAIVNRKPAVAVNGTKPGAAAVALVKAVDRAIATNPQSAGNSTGTPKGSAKAPLFKAEAAAVDSIKAAIRG